jgi:hypothetical protein
VEDSVVAEGRVVSGMLGGPIRIKIRPRGRDAREKNDNIKRK